MVIGGYQQLYNKHFVGDKVWACAFQYSHDKNSKRFKQEPIYGMLTLTDIPNMEMERRESKMRQLGTDKINARYFIPFKKNGELAYSKSVQVSARQYATTEKECVEVYNGLVQKYIEWYKREIAELEKQKLK